MDLFKFVTGGESETELGAASDSCSSHDFGISSDNPKDPEG